jgi:hypothetical protein
MRKIARNLKGRGASQFFEGHAEVRFEDELLVVFEVNEKRKDAEAREFLAKEPHVLARGPGVHDVGTPPIEKNAGPVAIELVETVDGIILLTQAGASVGVAWDGNSCRVTQIRESIREIVDMDSAVGTEVVVKSEEDIAHAGRRGL